MLELKILHSSPMTNDVIVIVTDGSRSLNGTVPSDLLDDEVGDNANSNAREEWIKRNSEELSKAMVAKADGGFARKPFDRIIFQGEG